MKIRYCETEALVIIVPVTEPEFLVRTAEALIREFENEADVSYLRGVLARAKVELFHTLQ